MGYDRRFATVKVTVDGEDLADLFGVTLVEFQELILSFSINEEDESLSRFSMVIRNDGCKLTRYFIRAGLMKVRVWVGYSSFTPVENSGIEFAFKGTFLIDKPKFQFPSSGYPTIVLNGFSEEIELIQSEFNYTYRNMSDDQIVQRIAERYGFRSEIDLTRTPRASKMLLNDALGALFGTIQDKIETITTDAAEALGEAEEEGQVSEEVASVGHSILDAVSGMLGTASGQVTQIESDYTFMKKLAERNGFQFFIKPDPTEKGTLFFGRLTEVKMRRLGIDLFFPLKYGEGLNSIEFTIDMFRVGLDVQLEEVNPQSTASTPEVSWEFISAVFTSAFDQIIKMGQGPEQIVLELSDPAMPSTDITEIRDRIRIESGSDKLPVVYIRQFGAGDLEAATRYVNAIQQQGMWFISGSATPIVGIPKAACRSYVIISGVEGHFDAPYYIKSITHNWVSGKFSQTFELRSYKISGSLSGNSDGEIDIPIENEDGSQTSRHVSRDSGGFMSREEAMQTHPELFSED